MNRAEATKKAIQLNSLPQDSLRHKWRVACRTSGLKPRDFRNEVNSLRNILDGRCPDGCCGNEDNPSWQPSPAEWVVLAEELAQRLSIKTR